MTHICVVKITIIGSDNGLSPGRRQAIIWTNAGILLIGPLGTNFIEISIGIQTFSFKKMHLKMSSAKWRPFCLGLNVLISVNKRGPCPQYLNYVLILYTHTIICGAERGLWWRLLLIALLLQFVGFWNRMYFHERWQLSNYSQRSQSALRLYDGTKFTPLQLSSFFN